jgi:hypothetical protein
LEVVTKTRLTEQQLRECGKEHRRHIEKEYSHIDPDRFEKHPDAEAEILRMQQLQKRYPGVEFYYMQILWDEAEGFSPGDHGYGNTQYTIRPYVQGKGCDGTTDDNILLQAKVLCQRVGLQFEKLWYQAEKELDRQDVDRKTVKTWGTSLDKVLQETIIPDQEVFDIPLLLHDLEDLNRRALARVLEEALKAKGLIKDEDTNWWKRRWSIETGWQTT